MYSCIISIFYTLQNSDGVGEQKLGSGRVRGLLFGVGSGINISGTSPLDFGVLYLKSKVGVVSGSAFRGRVWIGVLKCRVVPLGFRVLDSITTPENKVKK